MALRLGRSRAARLLGLTAGLAATATMLATAASATATWTVKAGSAANGTTVSITGTTQGTTPQIHFSDATTSQKLTCDSGTAPGTVKVGSGESGTRLGKISGPNTTWNNCSGPAGLRFAVTGIGTWNINASSYASPVTTGHIAKVDATVDDPGLCTFTVTGAVAVNYSNATQVLTVPGKSPTLAISNVTGCFGAINNGDKAEFSAKYLLAASVSADNPITITSP